MGRHLFDITVAGEMDRPLCDEFEDLQISVERGVTRMRLVSTDQSMLHSVLDRVDSLGLELLDVRQLDKPAGP